MEPIDTIWNLIMAMLKPYHAIPESTLLTLAVAGILAVVSTSANRLLVDVKRAAAVTKEVNAWRKEFNEARKSNDKKLLAKLSKKQEAMMKLQSQVAFDRMKVSFWKSLFCSSTLPSFAFTVMSIDRSVRQMSPVLRQPKPIGSA